jgi:release factor glutamine methyltransferase
MSSEDRAVRADGDARAEPWTIARVMAWATQDLRSHGSRSARLDAELLLAQVLSCDRIRLVIDAERPLSRDELAAYKELHQRRRKGEPVAYLRGLREFFGRPFRVDRRVLIPRPETEGLVEVGLTRTRELALCARVLDVCTGSGCVAITVAKERPTNLVLASDLSADALEVAAENALRLGAQVGLWRSDLYAELGAWRKSFDLITANPPYIAEAELGELAADIRDFEPVAALHGGADGLMLIRAVVRGAVDMLAPAGVLAVEIGAGQASAARLVFEQAGFADIEIARDYGGHERVVSGRQPGTR